MKLEVEGTSQAAFASLSKSSFQNCTQPVEDVESSEDRLSELLRRQLLFQYLVKRYFNQILYGCENQSCTTPSCLSCQRRLANGRPFRSPTTITARTLAFFYASQSNPGASLCPHALAKPLAGVERGHKPSPTIHSHGDSRASTTTESKEAQRVYRRSSGSDQHVETNSDFTPITGLSEISRNDSRSNGIQADENDSSEPDKIHQPSIKREDLAWRFERETKNQVHVPKDRKSLGQTLFDSLGLIGFVHFDFSQHVFPNQRSFGPHGTHSPPLHSSTNTDPVQSTVNDCSGQFIDQNPNTLTSTSYNNRKEPSAQSNGSTQALLGGGMNGDLDKNSRKTPKVAKNELFIREKISHSERPRVSSDHSILQDPNAQNLYVHPNKPSSVAFRRLWLSSTYPLTLGQSVFVAKPSDFKFSLLQRVLPSPEAILELFEAAVINDHGLKDGTFLKDVAVFLPANSWIFDYLRLAIHRLFTVPPWIEERSLSKERPPTDHQNNDSLPKTKSAWASTTKYYRDEEVAKVLTVCLHALLSSPAQHGTALPYIRLVTSNGVMLPDLNGFVEQKELFLHLSDMYDHEPALKLASSFCRIVAFRRCAGLMSRNLESVSGKDEKSFFESNIMTALVEQLNKMKGRIASAAKDTLPQNFVSESFLEWVRMIFLRQWDGNPVLDRWDIAGASIEVMADLYKHREALSLKEEYFYIPYLHTKLDKSQTPLTYCQYAANPNKLHLIKFHFLFEPKHLVTYFRVVNYESLYNNYVKTELNAQLPKTVFSKCFIPKFPESARPFLPDPRSTITLEIRRECALQDSFDQLWRRSRPELLKPLKIILKGEEGLDQGGVSIEFFRVALAEAFNPNAGMFSTDSETRMSWFQPNSVEPLFRFELIGILFSLALYNGITLPVSMPAAFYLQLLSRAIRLYDIQDGWPRLAKSLNILLDWEGDDVADVFLRTYEYSFDLFGEVVNIDLLAPYERESLTKRDSDDRDDCQFVASMFTSNGSVQTQSNHYQDWSNSTWIMPPNLSASDIRALQDACSPAMVTNENREQYVNDYVHWLTYRSVSKQFDAFLRGFQTCLSEKALSILTPDILRGLLEGSQEVDTHSLEKSCQYEDGYSRDHQVIKWFWEIVHNMEPQERRQLLEFVTATDRVPISGVETIAFSIVRNGPDTERLPTSSTCFGKLLLPNYDDKEKLEQKLRLACQNSKGFGVV